jgi:hypothetical protein
MTEYLVLVKLNPGKIVDAIDSLRKLPERPASGVDLCYTMNIFGTWDVGVWVNAENTGQVVEFVHKKLRNISGITNIYTVPTFPHSTKPQRARQSEEEETAPEKTE